MSTEHEPQIDRIAEQLQALAAETVPPRPLPSAGEIWWRAEVIRRLTAAEEEAARAARPARWGRLAGLLVTAAIPAALLPLRGGELDASVLLALALALPPVALLFTLGLLRQEA